MTSDELKAARESRGWTQEQMATALKLGKGGARTVRRWESGERAVPGPVEAFLAVAND